jgi:hypothetical protein
MPSTLTLTGLPATARPGIYARIDASALSGGAPDSGRLALVGDFPTFPTAEPVEFTSRRAMTAYDSGDNDLAQLAALGFSPSNDPAANRGASALLVVNARETCTAASIDLGPVILTSRIYGPRSNRLTSTLTIDGTSYSLTLNRGGLSESFSATSSPLFNLANATGSSVALTIAAGVITLTGGVNLTIDSNEAPDLRAAIALLDQVEGLSATLIEPSLITLAELDYSTTTITTGANGDISAPGLALARALSASRLVSVAQDTTSAAGTLSAGTETATGGAQGSALGWADALAAIEAQSVQLVCLFTTDGAAQSLLAGHLTAAALAGYERQAFSAVPSTSSLSAARTAAAAINSPGVALAAQSVSLYNPRGRLASLDARYTALMLAGMKAGSDIGEPLTRKRPAILSTSQIWDTHADIEAALRAGLCVITRDQVGPRVERSLTTWLEDNNPVYTEVSAYESVLFSVRDLRAALADQIGRPTKASQMSLIESRVNARLAAQVKDGRIKAYQGVTLEDMGDQVAISYQVAPVEPLNFIAITAIAQRLSA